MRMSYRALLDNGNYWFYDENASLCFKALVYAKWIDVGWNIYDENGVFCGRIGGAKYAASLVDGSEISFTEKFLFTWPPGYQYIIKGFESEYRLIAQGKHTMVYCDNILKAQFVDTIWINCMEFFIYINDEILSVKYIVLFLLTQQVRIRTFQETDDR